MDLFSPAVLVAYFGDWLREHDRDLRLVCNPTVTNESKLAARELLPLFVVEDTGEEDTGDEDIGTLVNPFVDKRTKTLLKPEYAEDASNLKKFYEALRIHSPDRIMIPRALPFHTVSSS